jgi:hypothetical protein
MLFCCRKYVGKIQFSLSDIVAPDSLIGHHKTQHGLTRLSSVVYQDILRRLYRLIIYLYILVRTLTLIRPYWCWLGSLLVPYKML